MIWINELTFNYKNNKILNFLLFYVLYITYERKTYNLYSVNFNFYIFYI